jgi:hypothetical protein
MTFICPGKICLYVSVNPPLSGWVAACACLNKRIDFSLAKTASWYPDSDRYNFPVLEPVESYLSDLLIVDEETLIARSMKLEPPYRYVWLQAALPHPGPSISLRHWQRQNAWDTKKIPSGK